MAEVEHRRLPTLGVCLGSQLMNVYRGGSMHQFLPDVSRNPPIEHRKLGENIPRHPVTLDTTSRVGQAIGKTEISVNSYHKQSADHLGRGLRVTATAPDGVIEAFEDPDFPAVRRRPMAPRAPDRRAGASRPIQIIGGNIPPAQNTDRRTSSGRGTNGGGFRRRRSSGNHGLILR